MEVPPVETEAQQSLAAIEFDMSFAAARTGSPARCA